MRFMEDQRKHFEKVAHGIGGKEKKGNAYLENEGQENEIDIDPNFKVEVRRPYEELELEALREEIANSKIQA